MGTLELFYSPFDERFCHSRFVEGMVGHRFRRDGSRLNIRRCASTTTDEEHWRRHQCIAYGQSPLCGLQNIARGMQLRGSSNDLLSAADILFVIARRSRIRRIAHSERRDQIARAAINLFADVFMDGDSLISSRANSSNDAATAGGHSNIRNGPRPSNGVASKDGAPIVVAKSGNLFRRASCRANK